jgi:4-carboxymuconolactone decarboxylase
MAYLANEFETEKETAIAEVERRTGPSNFFRAMSHRPDAMRAAAQFYQTVMTPGSISERLKEMVSLAVSFVNECGYCTVHHEAGAKKAGLTDEEVEDLRAETDYHLTEQERAAVRYARELTRTASAEHDTIELLEINFQPDQRVELTLVVGLANFTNRFNNGLRVPLEKDKHSTA